MRVADHFVAVDQHRHPALVGELLDLGAVPLQECDTRTSS